MNRKNTAATDRLIEAVHGSYVLHMIRVVIRFAKMLLCGWRKMVRG